MKRTLRFSEMLRYYRTSKNMTLEQLAKKLGRGLSTVAKWELGTRSPKFEEVIKIAEALQIDPKDLLFGEDKANETPEKKEKIISIYNQLDSKKQEELLKQASRLLSSQKAALDKEGVSLEDASRIKGVKLFEHLDYNKGKDALASYLSFWIKGNAFTPLYHDGDIIFVEVQDEPDYDGQSCILYDALDDAFYLKRVFLLGNEIRLVSLNQSINEDGRKIFPDVILPRDEHLRIVGKMVDHYSPIFFKTPNQKS